MILFALDLLCFYSKVCSSYKNLKPNYMFFVKPTCFFINSKNKWHIFQWLCWYLLYKTNIDILQTFSTLKCLPEAYLETIGTSIIRFLIFLKEAPPQIFYWVLNTAYNYIQVSLIEIVRIMNFFAVKYLFLTKQEWNKVAISKLKFIRLHFILA